MKKKPVLLILVFIIPALIVSCTSSPSDTPPASQTALPYAQPAPLSTSPHLRVTFSPDYFSPVNGDLAIYLFAMDETPITGWRIEIQESLPPYLLFHEWKGQGKPPEMISWNGKNAKGELVLAATDYLFVFSVSNAQGNSTTIDTFIKVSAFGH